MIVRLCVVLLLAVSGLVAEVTVENNSYHNLLISFSPNVNEENGESIVQSVKGQIEKLSETLYIAIGLRFHSVTFHVPSTWNTSAWKDMEVKSATVPLSGKEDILVDNVVDSAFGTRPFTLQYGGCGIPGQKITVPTTFLEDETDDYPKEKLLAREWLKYRYGVFDENGYENDGMYPSYYQIPGTLEVKVTECTHPEVEFYFKKGSNNQNASGEDCSLELPFASDDCQIRINANSTINVTSSLMYYHQDLPNVETVCKKEHHKDFTPSKHNRLCGGKSIWEVLEASTDFRETTTVAPQADDGNGIEFSYIQETKPRVVIAFENSDNLHDQKDTIRFAIRRLIYSLPDGSELGIYNFNQKNTEIRRLSTFSSNSDREVNLASNFVASTENICGTCVISDAVQAFAEKPQIRGSVILIVGANISIVDEALINKVKESNICWTVIAFTNEGTATPGIEILQSSNDCSSILELPKEKGEYTTFDELYQAMQEAVPEPTKTTQSKMVTSGTMSFDSSLDIPMDSTAGKYTLWMTKLVEDDGIGCVTGDAVQVNLSPADMGSNIASYTFDPVDGEVKCKLRYPKLDPVFTQVMMTTKPGEYFKEECWIHDTSESTEEQMPVIVYAKINFGDHPVQSAKVIANITLPNGEIKELELFDNGRGNPDITSNDGIYSRYFVDLESEGEYLVTVTADDNRNQAKVGINGTDRCCGSKVESAPERSLSFRRKFETSFTSNGKKPEGGYKPSTILDLSLVSYDPMNSIVLNWTAPGGEADNGNAEDYVLKCFTVREYALTNFEDGLSINITLQPQNPGTVETYEVPFDNFQRNAINYLAMKSVNKAMNESSISNIVAFFVPDDIDPTKIVDETTTAKTNLERQSGMDKQTIGIIIGVLVLVIVLGIITYLVIYFLRRKPARKEAKKSDNASNIRGTSSPPISLNSIPADILIKHHNEVVSAKSQHKDPPIFREENLESGDSTPKEAKDTSNVAEYSQVQKRQPDSSPRSETTTHPPKSPKRMTNV